MPRLFIIAGCNGSGKTTASYALLPGMLECSEFVNSDEFAKSLSPFHPESAYVAASRYMLMKMRFLLQRKADFCIETTLATRSLLKVIKDAKEAGYYVTILYFWLNSPDLAVARVAARVAAGGHNIKEETIRRRYNVGLHYLFRDFMPLCDRWLLLTIPTCRSPLWRKRRRMAKLSGSPRSSAKSRRSTRNMKNI